MAGIAGSLIAAALPLDDLAQALKAAQLPPVVVPMIIVGFMTVCGQLAMNSVLSATIIASVLPAPLLLGADPSLVAASYMIGWGITVSSSPFSLSTLMVANIHGSSPRTVAYGWNRRFVPLAILFVASYMGVISYFLS